MSSIKFEITSGVGIITLNRPDKMNSFNREMALLLQEKLDECASSAKVRSVLITGSGKAFCAGQDLAEAIDPNGPGMNKILVEHYNPIVARIRSLEKPVLAAVNGVAAGAGANLAICCDIVVGSASSSFIQAFCKIGLVPDTGGTFFLPRLIGMQKATALMMLGDKISASEAEQMGMIYKVFPDEDFLNEALNLARRLAEMPTRGLYFTKKALELSMNQSLEVQLVNEDNLQQKAAATKDFKEGVHAFLEKRKAEFIGQ